LLPTFSTFVDAFRFRFPFADLLAIAELSPFLSFAFEVLEVQLTSTSDSIDSDVSVSSPEEHDASSSVIK
jgi:hypothetical protein